MIKEIIVGIIGLIIIVSLVFIGVHVVIHTQDLNRKDPLQRLSLGGHSSSVLPPGHFKIVCLPISSFSTITSLDDGMSCEGEIGVLSLKGKENNTPIKHN